MKLEFKLLSGEEIVHETKKNSFVIGRSPYCDIIVPFEGFSRKHCQIDITDEGDVFLTDLDSANGVIIDGKKINPLEKTSFNLLLPLVIGPAEVTLELSTVSAPAFQNISSPPGVHPVSGSKDEIKKEKKQISKTKSYKEPYDFKLVGLIVMAVIGFFIYSEVKGFLAGGESEDDKLNQMQFEAQLKNRKNDGSIKTKDF